MKESISKQKADNLWQKSQFSNLIRYIPSGTYYARVRIKGKLKLRSLKTRSLDVAQRKLGDFVKEEKAKVERLSHQAAEKGAAPTFGELLAIYRSRNFRPLRPRTPKDQVELKPGSIGYYEQRAKALLVSWPDLEKTPVNKLTVEQFDQWSERNRPVMSGSAFNHTVGLVRNVLQIAVERGAMYDNPARYLVRKREKPKRPVLPSVGQFELFVRAIETSGSGKSKPCANLVRFLAYGGFRIHSEARWITWADCDFERREIHVRGNPVTGTKGTDGEPRRVPMIPQMRELLLKLRDQRREEPETAPVMEVFECQKAMDRAARFVGVQVARELAMKGDRQKLQAFAELGIDAEALKTLDAMDLFHEIRKRRPQNLNERLGIQRLTHHDLRDIFTTQCIESGVPIPTVAKWLGHKDGGALLMRTYAHLRDSHSAEMARRVSFGVVKPENIVQLDLLAI